jgi:hypothetical protein
MGRSKKSVLNQVFGEPKKEEVVEEQVSEAVLDESVEEVETEIPMEESPEVVFTNDPIEIDLMKRDEAEEEIEEESYESKLARFLNNKTSSPYRLYLRTGIIPKL